MAADQANFAPFHAIVSFMRPDYQQSVVQNVLNNYGLMPETFRKRLDQETRKFIQVQGFRNSDKAPASARIRPTVQAFGKHPSLASVIFQAWAELHADLAKRVYEVLNGWGWKLYPVDMDRSKLPGIIPTWPKGVDFDTLMQDYKAAYPDNEDSSDDVSLMAVWIGQRLPYLEPVDDGA